jgi:hypothetical protein
MRAASPRTRLALSPVVDDVLSMMSVSDSSTALIVPWGLPAPALDPAVSSIGAGRRAARPRRRCPPRAPAFPSLVATTVFAKSRDRRAEVSRLPPGANARESAAKPKCGRSKRTFRTVPRAYMGEHLLDPSPDAGATAVTRPCVSGFPRRRSPRAALRSGSKVQQAHFGRSSWR